MKTTNVTLRNRTIRKGQPSKAPRFNHADISFPPARTQQAVIQWPSEKQLLEVSKRLKRINQLGIRWEAKGDYFNSGDLAYQIQEIIRATDDLFRKAQRIKGNIDHAEE
jgi:hypothetical protein